MKKTFLFLLSFIVFGNMLGIAEDVNTKDKNPIRLDSKTKDPVLDPNRTLFLYMENNKIFPPFFYGDCIKYRVVNDGGDSSGNQLTYTDCSGMEYTIIIPFRGNNSQTVCARSGSLTVGGGLTSIPQENCGTYTPNKEKKKTDPDPEPDPGPDPGPDPEPDPEPDPGPDPEPDPGPNPEPDPRPDPEPDPGPDPEPDPEPDPGPDPEPDPRPDPEPDPGPDPEPDPEPDPGPDPKPEFNKANFRASVSVDHSGTVLVGGSYISSYYPQSFGKVNSTTTQHVYVTFTVPPNYSNSGQTHQKTYYPSQPPMVLPLYDTEGAHAVVSIDNTGKITTAITGGAILDRTEPVSFNPISQRKLQQVRVYFKVPAGYSNSGDSFNKLYSNISQPPQINSGECISYTIVNEGGGDKQSFTYTRCDGSSGSNSVPLGDSITICAQARSITYPPNTGLTDLEDGSCGKPQQTFDCEDAEPYIQASIDAYGQLSLSSSKISLVSNKTQQLAWTATEKTLNIAIEYKIPKGYTHAGSTETCQLDVIQPISHPILGTESMPTPSIVNGSTGFHSGKSSWGTQIVIDKADRNFPAVTVDTPREIDMSLVVPDHYFNRGATLRWTRTVIQKGSGPPPPPPPPVEPTNPGPTDPKPVNPGPVNPPPTNPPPIDTDCKGTTIGDYVAASPDASQNYIHVKVYQDAQGKNALEQVQYFDGLGRPIQTVAVGISPSGGDLVTHMTYDAFDRQDKTYLPTPMGGSPGSYRSGMTASAKDYHQVANPYSETVYEASPLNRVLAQKAPGSFADHPIQQSYDTNAEGEVNYYTVSDQGSISSPRESYAAGTLYKNGVEDENGHTTYTYTDLQGQVVLKRAPENTDTYYLYDDYGNLRYVLPPAAEGKTDATTLAQLGYQYHYDLRNRLISKQLPGKGVEYIVYDALDRVVLTQDAQMRADNLALKTVYDAHDRVVQTGFIEATTVASQEALALLSDQTLSEVLTHQYYDDYNGLKVLEKPTSGPTHGLPTWSKTKILGTSQWITSVTGYDDLGRAVSTATHNPILDVVETQNHQLDFVGRVTQTTTTHKKGSTQQLEWVDDFKYDTTGRMLKQSRTLEGKTETVAAHCYNDLGQLERKTLGGDLQTLNYQYNIRGWLTQTNDPSNLGKDLFAFTLGYNTSKYETKALYNGNIAFSEWRSVHNTQTNWYAYQYDALNRLKIAAHSGGKYSMAAQYDKNGNIENLNRKGYLGGSFGNMDALVYSYAGNQLKAVQDTAEKSFGFKDGVNQTIEYTYDVNGNMLSDANKRITNITYNHLNLPTQVNLAQGNIDYLYDASGAKIKKTVQGNTTEYFGNTVYQNGELEFIHTPEGYIEPTDAGYEYIYRITDHLGNTRVSFKKNVLTDGIDVLATNDYYPFGLEHNKAGTTVESSNLGQRYKFNGVELNEDLGLNLYEMDFRQYDPTIGRFTGVDPITHYDFSTYVAFDNAPTFWADPSGANAGCPEDDPNCDQANQIDLDEVVVTAPKTESPNNNSWSSEIHSSGFSNWNTSFKGTLNDWNQAQGTNFSSNEDAMAYWTQTYVTDPDKEQWMNEFYSGMASMRMGAVNLINVATLPISIIESGFGLMGIFARGGGQAVTSLGTTAATYADDVVLYTSGAARAPKGGLYNLGTNTFHKGGTFLPRSSQQLLNYSKGAQNIIYQTLPRIGSQTGFLNVASNQSQVYFSIGVAGAHTVAAPLMLINNRKNK